MQYQANKHRRIRKELNITVSRSLVRHIQSKQEVLASQKVEIEANTYVDYASQLSTINTNVMKFKFYGDSISRVLIDAIKVAAVLWVSYWFLGWVIDVSFFVTLMIILWLLNNSLYKLSRLYITSSWYYINVEKLRNIFDESPTTQGYNIWKKFSYTQWDIGIKNVSFAYTEQWWGIFDDFSLVLPWWQKTAIVWPSWSWKSTLVKLIAWYIKPDKGNIYIDWQSLKETSLQSYYQHIWYLTQEPSIFDGTVRENLLYWASLSNEIQLKQAIIRAHCEFVYNLPNWLDTEIGERGVRLSWWQRQRLAIAKIFLKNPQIIILDEPTSALDSFSEQAITDAMNELFKWRTVIIIAHRLQTVKNADDIILLENWKVSERWTHDELVKLWWHYATMLELQSGF